MPSISKEKIGQLLVENNFITQEKLNEALELQKQKKENLADILIRLGYISRDNLMEVLSIELGIPAIHLSKYKITPEILQGIPKRMAENHCMMPISRFGNTITVAMADPMNVMAIDDIKRLTKMEVRPVLANELDIKQSIEQYYGVGTGIGATATGIAVKAGKMAVEAAAPEPAASVSESLSALDNEPVVKLTNSIIVDGVLRRSSDIFIEPEEASMRVRYRVDGLLQEGVTDAKVMHLGVVSRIKVMSKLDIAEHRVPQDGRFKAKVKDKEVDFRVSVLPTYFGEKIVLRVLDKQSSVLDLEKSGFEPEPLAAIKKASEHPHGMIAICGPTGSGKTTTLYSTLKLIDKPETNIVTVEDPVEFQLPGINQVAVRSEVKLTFAAALRSILRQDPDVIMVGEIRDSETADVAVKAALTGHLVLSTLHATTAPGAITRLVNMGIEPFLITSSLLLAGSQRLVRKVCEKCKEGYEPSNELIQQLGMTEKQIAGKKLVFYRGKGCDACKNKGYSGRAVLLETLTISQAVKALILKGAPEYQLKVQGRKEGMLTLRENGNAKILQGITTPEEVMRVTVRDTEGKA